MWYRNMFILMIISNTLSSYFTDINLGVYIFGILYLILGYVLGGVFKFLDIINEIKGDDL